MAREFAEMAKNFKRALRRAVKSKFGGVENRLATAAKIDRALVNRLLTGDRDPSPVTVGKIAGTLPATDAHALLAAYLTDVAEAVREEAGLSPGVTESKLHEIASGLRTD